MKLILKACLCCLLAGISSLRAQDTKFTLRVKMQKPTVGYMAFLQYHTGPETESVDSAAYINGAFEIKGTTFRPQRAYLYLAPQNKGFVKYSVTLWRIPVYLEKGKILVSGKDGVKGARLSGTPLNNVLQGYADVVDKFTPRLESLRTEYGKASLKKDTLTLRKLSAGFALVEKETKKAEEDYFLGHLNSPVSFEWLKSSFILAKNKSKVEELFGKLGSDLKESESGSAFKKLLDATQSVELGQPAPDFSAKNVKDEDVLLSSFKGKYVLLDFWASWCSPCREENPNLVKAFNAYKSKNFTVVGYTMDSNKKSWENAIVKDNLNWAQLSGFGLKGNLAPKLYGITAIPNNFLIDPSGKIIGINLRGEELQEELARLLK